MPQPSKPKTPERNPSRPRGPEINPARPGNTTEVDLDRDKRKTFPEKKPSK
jgi:hypothetical protein